MSYFSFWLISVAFLWHIIVVTDIIYAIKMMMKLMTVLCQE